MRIAIQSRTWVIVALLIFATLGGLTTGREFYFDLAWTLTGLLALALAYALSSLAGLKLMRKGRSRRLQLGQVFEERLALDNQTWLPKLWVEVRDQSDLPWHNPSRVISLLPGKRRTWSRQTITVRRGRFRLGAASLHSGDPFGLFHTSRPAPASHHLLVYPRIYPLDDFFIAPGIVPGGEAIRRRTPFITPNAAGVRDYQTGDSFNRIHWKSTARRSRLMVKEFELDPQGDVWLILDGYAPDHYAPPGVYDNLPIRPVLPPTTEEYAVAATAALADYFIRNQRAVGLLAYGNSREIIPPDQGARQHLHIMETLAVFRAGSQLPLATLLSTTAERFPRGATVIIVTPTADHEWATAVQVLRQRGLQVVVVLVDRASFGGPPNVDRVTTALGGHESTLRTIRQGEDIGQILSAPEGRPGK